MKRVLFFLLTFIIVTFSSFSTPPVENSKDNWVYELNKPVIKPYATITCTAAYVYYQGVPWGISVAATSSDNVPYDRTYGINIKFRRSNGTFAYTLYYINHPAGYTYSGEIVDLTWPLSSTIVSWTSGFIVY